MNITDWWPENWFINPPTLGLMCAYCHGLADYCKSGKSYFPYCPTCKVRIGGSPVTQKELRSKGYDLSALPVLPEGRYWERGVQRITPGTTCLTKAVAALRALPYPEYLQTEHWRRLRQKVFQRDGFRCVRCGSGNSLQAHHLDYCRRGYEHLEDLETLCKRCHEEEHPQWERDLFAPKGRALAQEATG